MFYLPSNLPTNASKLECLFNEIYFTSDYSGISVQSYTNMSSYNTLSENFNYRVDIFPLNSNPKMYEYKNDALNWSNDLDNSLEITLTFFVENLLA